MDSLFLLQGDPHSSLTPLVLIHAVSGVATPYLSLDPLCPEDRPVYAISSPFITSQLFPFSPSYGKTVKEQDAIGLDLVDVAWRYVELIDQADIYGTSPWLLGGWSLGGMLAFQMVKLLEQRSTQVRHCIMLDSVCPAELPDFQDESELNGVVDGLIGAMRITDRLQSTAGQSPSSLDKESEDSQRARHPDREVKCRERSLYNTSRSSSTGSSASYLQSSASSLDGSSSLSTPLTSQYSSRRTSHIHDGPKSFVKFPDTQDTQSLAGLDAKLRMLELNEASTTSKQGFKDSQDLDEDEEEESAYAYQLRLHNLIRRHVTHNLRLLSPALNTDLRKQAWSACEVQTRCTLIRCSKPSYDESVAPETERQKWQRRQFQHPDLGWERILGRYQWNTITYDSDVTHNFILDRPYVTETSQLLARVLQDLL